MPLAPAAAAFVCAFLEFKQVSNRQKLPPDVARFGDVSTIRSFPAEAPVTPLASWTCKPVARQDGLLKKSAR
jgi:hypothetical protein